MSFLPTHFKGQRLSLLHNSEITLPNQSSFARITHATFCPGYQDVPQFFAREKKIKRWKTYFLTNQGLNSDEDWSFFPLEWNKGEKQSGKQIMSACSPYSHECHVKNNRGRLFFQIPFQTPSLSQVTANDFNLVCNSLLWCLKYLERQRHGKKVLLRWLQRGNIRSCKNLESRKKNWTSGTNRNVIAIVCVSELQSRFLSQI